MAYHTLKADSLALADKGRKILHDVYLSCSQGEVVGLLGRNGSGKTSLLKIIFGSLAADYKHVSINDNFVEKGYHQNRIAYLPQHPYLPKGIRIHRLAKVLVDEAAWDEFAALPIYQDNQYKTVNQLSGGELRQLETLMIIYNSADFILLDEPFTHVSPIQADLFKPIIRQRAKSKGIVVTDHQYHHILEISDRIILINNGCTQQISNYTELVRYGYLNASSLR